MRRLGPFLLLVVLSAPSGASPLIGLSWNRCDPPESVHPVLGPDRKAHLFVSLDGLSGDVTALTIRITIHSTPALACGCGADGVTVPPAWSFEPGGCQGPERIGAVFGPADAGCASLGPPASFTSSTTARDSVFCLPGTCGSAKEVVTLDALAPHAWTLVAQDRVAVWQVDFDLSRSCRFTGGDCCPDTGPLVLVPSGIAYFDGGSQLELAGSSVTYSPEDVPARPASWGRLKAGYR